MSLSRWFIPSFFGDVRLERTGDGCVIVVQGLTDLEREGLAKFLPKAQSKGWIAASVETLARDGRFPVDGDIQEVGKILAKFLKSSRQLVDVILFEDGTVKDVSDGSPDKTPVPTAPPKAGATVAQPTQGCPAPDFAAMDVRATEVLLSFLNPQQADDWRKHQSFITKGASGARYAITSRHAVDKLRGTINKPGFERTFYCLDDRQAFCVHDWVVPAAEEVLTMHLMVQTPHGERYLRHLE